MADPTGFTTSADIAGALATLFKDKIIVTWNRSCPEMAFLTAKPATAKNVTWDVKFGANVPGQAAAGGKFTDGAPVTAVRKEIKVPATLNFANYHEAFGLTGKAKAQAKVTANPDALTDLYGDELRDAVGRLAVNLMVAMYSGDGSTDEIWGMFATGKGPMLAVGTYAGIDPTVSAQAAWLGNEIDAAAVAVDFALLRRMRRAPIDATGMPPNLYICSTAMFDAIATLYDNNRRWVDEVTRGDGAKIRVDGAVEMMTWQGARIIWSPRYPNSTSILGLNLDEIHVEQLPDGPDAINEGAPNVPLQSMPEEQEGTVNWPLQALMQPLAKAGNAYNFDLQMYPQLVVDKRNAHSHLVNLAVAV